MCARSSPKQYYTLPAHAPYEIVLFIVDVNNGSFAVESVDDSSSLMDTAKNFIVSKHFLGKAVKFTRLEGFKQIGTRQCLVFFPDGSTEKADIELTTDEGSEAGQWHTLIEDDGSAVIQEVFGDV